MSGRRHELLGGGARRSIPMVMLGVLAMLGSLLAAADRVGGATAQVAKLTASDAAAEDRLGRAIAMTDDTLLLGAWTDDHSASVVDAGTVYVFNLIDGVWTETQKLQASDAASGDQYGVEVAIDGDLAVVGSFRDDDPAAGADAGSVYVYARTATGWVEEAKITASDAAAGDEFGHTVRLSGETILVGTWNDDDDGTNSGSAYVYTRSGTGWTEQAKLTASDAAAGDQYGISVAISGDTAAVGSWRDDDTGADSGSVYIYRRTGTTWQEEAKLTAPGGRAGDRFGGRMAADADTVLVGAWRDDDLGVDSGSAHIFVRNGSTWSHQAKLNGADTGARDAFGLAAALSGDRAVITAWRDDQQASNAGAAYVFERTGSQWSQTAKLMADDGGVGDELGVRVGLAGDTVVVGAWQHDDGASNTGAAYVFSIDGDDPPPPTGRTYPPATGSIVINGVSLNQRATTLDIVGSGAANTMYLTEVDGDIQVAVLGSDGAWSGRSYRSSTVSSIKANMAGGDDTVTFGDAANHLADGPFTDTVAAAVTLELGQGDDGVTVVPGTTISGNLVLRALGGATTVELGDLTVAGTASVTTRNDDDTVDLAAAQIGRRTTLNLGGGTNEITANGANLAGGLTTRTTSGPDRFSMLDSQVGSTAAISLSSGSDVFEATGTTFARRATINLSSGDNQATVDDTTFAQGFSLLSGNQIDTIDFSRNKIGRGLGLIRTGSGNDMLTVGVSEGSFRADAGAGNDTIEIPTETMAGATATILAGSGNDEVAASLEVVGGQPQVGSRFIANGGSGTDSMTVTTVGDPADASTVLAALRLSAFETVTVN